MYYALSCHHPLLYADSCPLLSDHALPVYQNTHIIWPLTYIDDDNATVISLSNAMYKAWLFFHQTEFQRDLGTREQVVINGMCMVQVR